MPLDTVTPFTPLASTLGGVLIGLSAVLVMALFGRIAGISGITTGAIPARRDDWDWRLVGLGTVNGSGCTSGHGVCGLARLSTRSLVAVLTFMAFAFATVFLIRHVF